MPKKHKNNTNKKVTNTTTTTAATFKLKLLSYDKRKILKITL